MNKSDIRKKILKIRKLNNNKYLDISFEDILKIIEKYEIKSRIIGGYYSYNHEVDLMKVLEKFEKNNYQISLPKVKNNSQMNFFHATFCGGLRRHPLLTSGTVNFVFKLFGFCILHIFYFLLELFGVVQMLCTQIKLFNLHTFLSFN